MFIMYTGLSFVVIGAISAIIFAVYEWRKINNQGGWAAFGGLMVIVAAFILALGLIISLSTHSTQISLSLELEKISSFEQTYQARSDNLTSQFAHYLAEVYPDHEKDIFSKIEPDKVDVYLAKYPELQASKTITALVEQIRLLSDDIYKQRLTRAETLRDMRYNVRSPWIYQWMMPSGIVIPEK